MSDTDWKELYEAVKDDRERYAQERDKLADELKKTKREYHLLTKECLAAESLLREVFHSGWKPQTKEQLEYLDKLALSIGAVLIG